MNFPFLAALALTTLLAIPHSHAGKEDVAYFEKTYQTKLEGVKPIKEYPDPALFYAVIAERLGIREKALAAAKANGWKEHPQKLRNAIVNRSSATARWQIIISQMKLDRKNNEVDRESIEITMLELDDQGKAHQIKLSDEEAETRKEQEKQRYDGVLALMAKMQPPAEGNQEQGPSPAALARKVSEILKTANVEVLKGMGMLGEAAPPVAKVPDPPLAIAPSGLTLVVCDSSNKVLDTIVIPRAQEAITYRISVPEGMVEVRAFAIGKGRILDWLSEDLTENYCEARTDDKGSNSRGRMDATVEDFQFKGFSGIAGRKPLDITDEMLSQIKKDIAEDKRAPFITVISKGKQAASTK